VEDGYEFFAKRQLVTLFSAPNYCGEFDNAGAMMSVDETLMCSFQVCRLYSILAPLFPLPSSLFPLPSSLFPLPSSLFPLPSSVFLPLVFLSSPVFSRLPSSLSRLPFSLPPVPRLLALSYLALDSKTSRKETKIQLWGNGGRAPAHTPKTQQTKQTSRRQEIIPQPLQKPVPKSPLVLQCTLPPPPCTIPV
jgi:hypothetical protein